MSAKWNRRALQLFGFLIGALFGLWRPETTQSILPIIGIGVGISYFFLSRQLNEEKEVEEIPGFLLVQLFMYFLLGSALTSTILLAIQMTSAAFSCPFLTL